MAYPRLTRYIAFTALLLFVASFWVALFPSRRSIDPDPASCAAVYEPGDVWVRWVEDGERAEITPVAHLGKETHRLQRRAIDDSAIDDSAAGDGAGEGSAPSHAVMGRDGLIPCYCGRAEQLWKKGSLPGLDAISPGGRWMLAIDECFPVPPPIEVALDRRNRGPLEIAMPAVGALRVRLWPAAESDAFNSLATVVVRAVDAGPSHPAHDVMRFSLTPGEERRLPDILVGRRFSIEAIALRGELVERFEFDGPSRAGEEREVEVCFGDHLPLLRLRCLDEQGAPIANRDVRATWFGADEVPLQKRFRTREDGSASFMLDVPPREERRGQLVLETENGERHAIAAITLPRSGPCVIEAFAWRGSSSLIAGRVLDERHRPIADAAVCVAMVVATEAGGDAAEAGGDAPPSSIRFARTLRTDAQGRFAWQLHRSAQRPAYCVLAARANGRAAPLRCVPFGSTELDLVAGPAASMRGQVVLPPGLQGETHVSLKPQLAGLPVTGEFLFVPVGERGEFQFANLAAGRYTLEVEFPKRPWIGPSPYVALRDIEVRAGELCLDPLLEEIDCRSVFTTFEFELTSEGRRLAPSLFAVYVRSSTSPGPWHGVPLEPLSEGKARLVLARGTYDFRFESASYQPNEKALLRQGCVIEVGKEIDRRPAAKLEEPHTWDRSLRVEVKFAPMPQKAAARREFEKSLEFLWQGQRLPSSAWERRGSGRYFLKPPSAGEVEVRWTLPTQEFWQTAEESTVLQIARTKDWQVLRVALTPR